MEFIKHIVRTNYLVFSTNPELEKEKIQFSVCGDIVSVYHISPSVEKNGFPAYIDVRDYIGMEIEITAFGDVHFWFWEKDEISEPGLYLEEYRPKLHFTPKLGWMNDPNGLYYKDGVWNMFYQHNPCSTDWGNIEWGHAVSLDLVHWTEKKAAVCPVGGSIIASGGAVIDSGNRAGFGKDAALLYFTEYPPSTDGKSFDGKGFTQKIALFDVAQESAIRYEGNPIVDNIGCGNRDPQVSWCEEKNCYIMAVFYGDGTNSFVLFESRDLINWTEFQRIDLPGDEECPALIPIIADDGTRHWILSGAHGIYLVGCFISGRFQAEDVPRVISYGKRYAAQWFANAPSGRLVRMAWNTLYFESPRISQQMSFPTSTSLIRKEDGYRLCEWPVEEIESLYSNNIGNTTVYMSEVRPNGKEVILQHLEQCAAEDISICMDGFVDGELLLTVRGVEIHFDANRKKGAAEGIEFLLPESVEDNGVSLRILLDVHSMELFINHGEVLVTVPVQKKDNKVSISAVYYGRDGMIQIKSVQHPLRSMWEFEL